MAISPGESAGAVTAVVVRTLHAVRLHGTRVHMPRTRTTHVSSDGDGDGQGLVCWIRSGDFYRRRAGGSIIEHQLVEAIAGPRDDGSPRPRLMAPATPPAQDTRLPEVSRRT